MYLEERRGGYLWQGRFHSFVMDEAYLLAGVGYVELNSVKAKLCIAITDWKRSSVHAHLSSVDDEWGSVKPMLDRISNLRKYLGELFDASMEMSLEKHNQTGRPLGSNDFIDGLESQLVHILRKKRPGPTIDNN